MLFKLLNKTSLFVIIAGLAISSCKKLDLAPTDRYTEQNFWQQNGNVRNALNSVYNKIFTSQRFFFNEALSDNAYAQLDVNVGTPSAIASGSDGLFAPDLKRVLDDWSFYYNGIYYANLFLENADKNTTLDPAILARMKGEARFIRAYQYFQLITFYGDVPLITKIGTIDETKVLPRNPKAEVLSFILAELDAAASVLPKKEDYAPADQGRVTIGAAKALKARVLLYQGDKMVDVVTICEDLMNNQSVNGTYNTLQTNYSSVFSSANELNSEVIFDLPYIANVRTYDEPSRFIPISGNGNGENYNAPTQEFVDSYVMANGKSIHEAGSGYDENNPYVNRDPRFAATVVYDKSTWTKNDGSTHTVYIKPGSDPVQPGIDEEGSGLHTPTGYYWRKYNDPASYSNQFTTNLILLRWSDVLLMYAEAKNSLTQMTPAIWDLTIKPIRTRAGFTDPLALNYPGNSSLSLTDLIRNERRSELALESLRIQDIKRWGIGEAVMNGWVHGAKWGDPGVDNGYLRVTERRFIAKHYLWPVPATEIQKDNKLTQNPGW
jgi:starch-binding outer membrane protein, SusD/RagB family